VFTAIDDLLRPLYPHLTAADQCYFLREYTAGRGYAGSETNHLILNLKKPPDRRGKPEWRYKERAIEQVAREFRASVNLSALRRVTLIPMPPSKAKSDPLYDDRILQVLRTVDVEGQLDIRELLLGAQSMPATHATAARPTIAQLIANLVLAESLTVPEPRSIALVDDVLTTGAHFVAAKAVLAGRFPDASIRGLFVARRVHDEPPLL
jgi:hypothetical protein